MTDRLLTAEETSEILRVPISTLYHWSYQKSGGPPAIKVGRHLRYRVADLEAWLTAQTTAPLRNPRHLQAVPK